MLFGQNISFSFEYFQKGFIKVISLLYLVLEENQFSKISLSIIQFLLTSLAQCEPQYFA